MSVKNKSLSLMLVMVATASYSINGATNISATEVMETQLKSLEISIPEFPSANSADITDNASKEFDMTALEELIAKEEELIANIEALEEVVFNNQDWLSNDTIQAWNEFVSLANSEFASLEEYTTDMVAQIEAIKTAIEEEAAVLAEEFNSQDEAFNVEHESISAEIENEMFELDMLNEELEILKDALAAAIELEDQVLIDEIMLKVQEKTDEIDALKAVIAGLEAQLETLESDYEITLAEQTAKANEFKDKILLEITNVEAMLNEFLVKYEAYIVLLETKLAATTAIVNEDLNPTSPKPGVPSTPETPEAPSTPETPKAPANPEVSSENADMPKLADTGIVDSVLILSLVLVAVITSYSLKLRFNK